ncbi:MAG: transcriptional regulator, partial [Candidatus Sumerlaeota bacterium]|nr:transcriptional regulator [Candidatus Sumerlaeota bacterium]
RATEKGKYRIILVKSGDDSGRDPRMRQLIQKAGGQLVRRRFADAPALRNNLYASLVAYLAQKGELRVLPFDAMGGRDASLADISGEKLKWFLGQARHERSFALPEDTPIEKALTHLNLLVAGQPTHAALLLFGNNPQRFAPSAETKCLHFHGTQVQKPIPSYQIYKGTLFDQVDAAVDFVMAKLARKVTPQDNTPASQVEYELPYKAVREAIVNAIAHRDYTSNAATQVMLFADRLEVWNPGELPPGLTPEKLRHPHASIPQNPLIAEPLFLAHFIEKAGTGTLDMIARCQQAGIPEPVFEQRADQFVLTLPRAALTLSMLSQFALNDRQQKIVIHLLNKRRITNAEYQQLTGAIRKTAMRDLDDLVQKGLLEPRGTRRGAYYVLATKWDINGTNGTGSAKKKNGT